MAVTIKDTCYICGKSGHWAAQCPHKTKCSFCGGDHYLNNCPSYVKERTMEISRQAVQGDFTVGTNNNNNRRKSSNSRRSDTWVPRAISCQRAKCNGAVHKLADCPTYRAEGGCEACGGFNHLVRSCTAERPGSNHNSSAPAIPNGPAPSGPARS